MINSSHERVLDVVVLLKISGSCIVDRLERRRMAAVFSEAFVLNLWWLGIN